MTVMEPLLSLGAGEQIGACAANEPCFMLADFQAYSLLAICRKDALQ